MGLDFSPGGAGGGRHEGPWPNGPSLAYVSEGPDPVMTVVDKVAFESMPSRDRAICRALLVYSLKRLDEAEKGDAL